MNSPKSIFITISTFFTLLLYAFTSQTLPKNFKALLERDQLTFHASDSLVQVPIKENHQMNYDYALAYPSKHFEIRYSIRPMDSMIMEYKKNSVNKDSGSYSLPPQNMYQAAFMATSFNVFQTQKPNIQPFSPEAVKKEFNADWGGITAGNPKGKFGEGFSFCFIVFLHKKDVGNAYIYYLSDSTVSKSDFGKLMQPEFHNLKFE